MRGFKCVNEGRYKLKIIGIRRNQKKRNRQTAAFWGDLGRLFGLNNEL
jgi:hypothetical protein